jgi:uncharacterized protein YbjQ (UPF0145 family)
VSNPEIPERQDSRDHAASGQQIPMPAQPVIRAHEHWKIPFPIVDGPPCTLGWQWQSSGPATFVIIAKGQTGSYKVVERFPLTAEGWAQAWQALTATDAAAAEQVATAVAARNAASPPREEQVPHDGPPVLIVTTNDVPGYRIIRVHGDVFGLIVRARNYFSNLGASFRTLAGGEVAGYTKLLTDSRNQARERMWRAARAKGANAVIAMRFDCNEIGDIMSEVAAYGTAVTIEPIPAAPHPPQRNSIPLPEATDG